MSTSFPVEDKRRIGPEPRHGGLRPVDNSLDKHLTSGDLPVNVG
ncbi:hypothetical protein BEI_3791 [Halomonas beimenensis]|uniref:Uncharacterized protein n=1 Tax=Halomonas beimenensis TaxID=475662 RepID=A0A291PD50_9GAMM|nr:hypothetical protein BEI_3791 [Halomonas beimenensis]